MAQPPELIEELGAIAGGTLWRGKRPDGGTALVHRSPFRDEADRDRRLERLRSLSKVQSPYLDPPIGWWADTRAVYCETPAERGFAFTELPRAGLLGPQQAAVVSLAILEGLRALREAGLLHGALTPANVRVLPDGNVRLTGHHLAGLDPAVTADAAAELRAAGEIICAAFGIPVEPRPREAPRAIEHAAPALVQAARAIATGAMTGEPGLALGALREAAGPLARPPRMELGTEELAALVDGHRKGLAPGEELRFKSLAAPIGSSPSAAGPPGRPYVPPGAPVRTPSDESGAVAAAEARGEDPRPSAPPPGGRPPASTPERRSWAERHPRPLPHQYDRGPGLRRPLVTAAAILVLLLAFGGGYAIVRALRSGGDTANTAPPPRSTGPTAVAPTAAPSPLPAPLPNYGPPSAGSIRQVKANTTTGCSPGASCIIEVQGFFSPTADNNFAWSFKAFDRCTYQAVNLPGGSINQGGYVQTDGYSTVTLPVAKGQLAVYAIATHAGDTAVADPLLIGNNSC